MDLNKPIGKNAPSKKYPSKQTINLAMRDSAKKSLGSMMPLIILCFLVLVLLVKLGVLDQIAKVKDAEAQALTAEQMVEDMRLALKDYDAVLEEYENYRLDQAATSGSKVSAMESLGLIEQYLLNQSAVESFGISGDVITVQLGGVTLNQISEIYNTLRDDPFITGVEVYTAKNSEETNNTTTCSMTIFLLTAEDETALDPAAQTAEGGAQQ